MASGKTPRRSLPFPLKTDLDTIASDIGSLAKALDNDAETFQVTAGSELPAPKTAGRLAYVKNSKKLFWDTGTEWVPNYVNSEEIHIEAVTGEKLGEGTVRQKSGTAQSFLSWGVVSETGAVMAGSGDYTMKKISVGEYELKWNTAKGSGNYSLVPACVQGELTYNVVTETTKALILFSHGSGPVSTQFSFIAIAAS